MVAHSDHSALHLLPILQALGRRVPGGLALTGFDDLAESRIVTPPLTTVRPPFYEMGHKAVETLLELRAGKEVP